MSNNIIKIRNTGPIRKYINDVTCKTLIQAFISYQLDYGNASLSNIPLTMTNRLQRVQIRHTHLVAQITLVLFQLYYILERVSSL